MKKLVIIAAIVVSAAVSAHAQGRITFNSAAPGVNAKFFDAPGSPRGSNAVTSAMSELRADLFWTPGTTTVGLTSADLVNQGGFNQLFSSTPAQAGYFTGGSQTVTGWSAGSIVAQVRVWDTSFGGGGYAANHSQAGGTWFESPLFTITPTLSPTPAPNLIGLGNGVTYILTFNPVPEPATFGIGGLAAAAMLIIRRRK